VINAPDVASDRDVLLGCLQRQRGLVLWKLDGLRDSDARSVGTRGPAPGSPSTALSTT
jgi:hypothetical protein